MITYDPKLDLKHGEGEGSVYSFRLQGMFKYLVKMKDIGLKKALVKVKTFTNESRWNPKLTLLSTIV